MQECFLLVREHWRKTILFVTHDVDEAIALADRIVVMTHGGVAWESRVALERPRAVADLASEEANRLRGRILAHLELGTAQA
jgi:NitT/TauT family transport system ATP-binding protein